jgi:hypothetical protein
MLLMANTCNIKYQMDLRKIQKKIGYVIQIEQITIVYDS